MFIFFHGSRHLTKPARDFVYGPNLLRKYQNATFQQHLFALVIVLYCSQAVYAATLYLMTPINVHWLSDTANMTDMHWLQLEDCRACTRHIHKCRLLLRTKSLCNLNLRCNTNLTLTLAYMVTDLDPSIHGDNITRLVHTNSAVLSLSFGIRSQAVCSCVLVVIDNLPLVHPRSMHSRIKSFIGTLAVVL